MKPVLNGDGTIRNGRCRIHGGLTPNPRTAVLSDSGREIISATSKATWARYRELKAAGLPGRSVVRNASLCLRQGQHGLSQSRCGRCRQRRSLLRSNAARSCRNNAGEALRKPRQNAKAREAEITRKFRKIARATEPRARHGLIILGITKMAVVTTITLHRAAHGQGRHKGLASESL